MSSGGNVEGMTSPLAAPLAAVDDMIISVTEAAREKITELRDDEPEGKQLGLRLEILADTGGDFTYDLSFQEIVAADISDIVKSHGGLRVIIPAKDAPNFEGATLDYEHDGLVLRNPNKPRPFEIGTLILDDEISAEIRTVVADEINPALDAHGGFVTYLGHDGTGRAFMTMGGGCHGCSMSRMTMLQGVQTTIREKVPAIDKVVDATDHSTGSNPFYQ
jgi:Fe/S biogenesis protein NfuA